jgi:hypothetical protein
VVSKPALICSTDTRSHPHYFLAQIIHLHTYTHKHTSKTKHDRTGRRERVQAPAVLGQEV